MNGFASMKRFQFSSSVHQLAWRTSSLIITCAPLAIALASAHMSRQNHIFKRFITPLKYRIPVGAYTTHIDFPSHSDRTSLDFNAVNPQLVGSCPSTRTRLSLEPQPLGSHVAGLGNSIENATTSNVRSTTLSLILPSVNFDSYTTMVLRTVAWTIKCVLLAGTTAAYIAARVIFMALKILSPAELQDMEWTSFMPHV
ncbi:hypothetical protein BDZ94DRAFT_1252447 [Collybia nuda]|uniref:Uncharacterized protein n=1 Tax=Collybia nuda TaxID=64659 RepID=A0A9P5Y953_9AGAR|nr:hypothetical protein BDZ94DRAFT_1252447 [Collybia nuda]